MTKGFYSDVDSFDNINCDEKLDDMIKSIEGHLKKEKFHEFTFVYGDEKI